MMDGLKSVVTMQEELPTQPELILVAGSEMRQHVPCGEFDVIPMGGALGTRAASPNAGHVNELI